MLSCPELLSPAGSLEALKYAVMYGADAVYCALPRFGMRAAPVNLTIGELHDGCIFAHARGKKVYLTLNNLPTNDELSELPQYIKDAAEAGVDAFIIADLGVLRLAKQYAPDVDVHFSTQAGITNYAAATMAYNLGAKRVVLARELSLTDIAQIRDNTPPELELEAFVHGAMCMAYSGRCLISDHLAGRGANVGHCAQPCRWKYALVEETRLGQYFPVEQDDRGSFIMSSNDMNMLSHLQELADAGVNSVKIEGRAKGAYYVASTVNAYRHVLDGASADAWQAELETTSHRPYSTGFYFGDPGQNQGTVEYARSHQMVARVLGCAAEGDALFRAEVLCRNRFFEGEELEVISPDADVRTVRVENLRWHAAPETDLSDIERDGIGRLVGPDPSCEGGTLVAVGVANRTMERYSFTVPFELHERDILRIRRAGQDVGRVL